MDVYGFMVRLTVRGKVDSDSDEREQLNGSPFLNEALRESESDSQELVQWSVLDSWFQGALLWK